ncbi:MAG: anti-sigma factor family protein [Planctomycetota bacterium]|jgi:predicted anti-sigma-YlaC factor YlaD
MDCETYQIWINRQADQLLSEDEAKMLSTHLSTCASCRAFEQDLEKMRSLFTAEEIPPISPDLRDRVLSGARFELAARRRRMLWATARRLCAAALILGALTVGLFYLDSSNSIQATDTNKEIHYEDLFQRGSIEDPELLEILLKTDNPREALRIYSEQRRR